MADFVSVVKKTRKGVFFIDIPEKIMKDLKLEPFMAGKIEADKKVIRLFGFKKTVKIKLDLSKKTLSDLKRIMKLEGYGSIDETFSNLVDKFVGKEKWLQTVYIYSEEFLKSKFILIDDYEKALHKKAGKQKRRTPTLNSTK